MPQDMFRSPWVLRLFVPLWIAVSRRQATRECLTGGVAIDAVLKDCMCCRSSMSARLMATSVHRPAFTLINGWTSDLDTPLKQSRMLVTIGASLEASKFANSEHNIELTEHTSTCTAVVPNTCLQNVHTVFSGCDKCWQRTLKNEELISDFG